MDLVAAGIAHCAARRGAALEACSGRTVAAPQHHGERCVGISIVAEHYANAGIRADASVVPISDPHGDLLEAG